jgi:hypothetical protein
MAFSYEDKKVGALLPEKIKTGKNNICICQIGIQSSDRNL